MQEALSCVVGVLKAYFQRHRSDKDFEQFYRKTVQLAEELDISPPVLPRYCRQPKWLDDGSELHQFDSVEQYYRQVFLNPAIS